MVRENPLESIYWARVILAIAAAVVCGLFNLKDFSGIATGLTFYFASCLLFRYVFMVRSNVVSSMKKIYTTGVGICFLTWIAAWLMLYTFLSSST